MSTEPLKVEVWSDIACPWCWVGLKNLEAAQKLIGETVDVTWRSFQLDPNASTETNSTIDYVEKLAAKYRVSTSEAQAMIDRMTQTGSSKGIEFRFDRLSPSNTFNAHRLLAWATTLGQQGQLKERLFSGYLNEGLSLNDPAVLAQAASDVGLDREVAEAILASDDYADSVLQDRSDAESLGVRGVPFFLIDSNVVLSGAQPPEVIAQALTEASSSRVEVSPVADDPSCSVDGC